MEPVNVQVIALVPTAYYHCQHCELTFQHLGLGSRIHGEQVREALPADLQEQFHALCDWVLGLLERYGARVRIKVIDAASVEGVWKSLRHGVRSYPAVVVGKDKFGADFREAQGAIERHLAAADKEDA